MSCWGAAEMVRQLPPPDTSRSPAASNSPAVASRKKVFEPPDVWSESPSAPLPMRKLLVVPAPRWSVAPPLAAMPPLRTKVLGPPKAREAPVWQML